MAAWWPSRLPSPIAFFFFLHPQTPGAAPKPMDTPPPQATRQTRKERTLAGAGAGWVVGLKRLWTRASHAAPSLSSRSPLRNNAFAYNKKSLVPFSRSLCTPA